jgi:hypothetical protein
LKPSSFAMRTSAGESRQRRAASAHALSSATFLRHRRARAEFKRKEARLYGLNGRGCGQRRTPVTLN